MKQIDSDFAYEMLTWRVHSWNALEEGVYGDDRQEFSLRWQWNRLSDAEKVADIKRVLSDFETYFYCPDCGKKFMIEDAVIRKKTDISFSLDNAIVPGWMKLKASGGSCHLRLCGKCAKKKDYLRCIISLIGGLLIPLIISFVINDKNYFFRIFFGCAIFGFVLSQVIYNWIDDQMHPDQYKRANDGNAYA